jgi:hypothetical protein
VRQPSDLQPERRHEPRHSKAFAFWIQRFRSRRRTSAWMLDESTGGAAFLTAATEMPPLGARVELSEMPTNDRMVRDGAGPLPQFARVIRHDTGDGLTRRVAVRFEADTSAHLGTLQQRTTTAARKAVAPVPPLPPPVTASRVVTHSL